MPCWVVPTIAAELWGVSIDHVLQRVRSGELAQRVDEGFMFVDVEPPAPAKVERPPTFTLLSAAEVEALRADEREPAIEPCDDADLLEHADVLDEDVASDRTDDEESQSPDDDEASVELGDWRAARRRTGMSRIPPRRLARPQAA